MLTDDDNIDIIPLPPNGVTLDEILDGRLPVAGLTLGHDEDEHCDYCFARPAWLFDCGPQDDNEALTLCYFCAANQLPNTMMLVLDKNPGLRRWIADPSNR